MRFLLANNRFYVIGLALIIFGQLIVASGCNRGRPSQQTPVHLVDNMDKQPKYKTQEDSKFYADGMAMRQPPAGTVAQGQLHHDIKYYTGKDSKGELILKSPVPITMARLQRGQRQFDIFCSPCHGRTGNGKGMVSKRGMLPPPTFHSDSLRAVEDGHIFDVIANGKGNMKPYRYQVRVEDRWAIVAYLRALQLSFNASEADVPSEIFKEAEPVVENEN